MKLYLVLLSIFLDISVSQDSEITILSHGISEDEQQTLLDSHNDCRKMIATGALLDQPRGTNLRRMKYDQTLAKSAQEIANTTTFAHVAVSDERWGVGQNIYMSMSTGAGPTPNWEGVVLGWFSEHSKYNYSECCTTGTGHYTQVIWADTEYVGCGYAFFIDPSFAYPYQKYYVCNYGPAGNIVGLYPYEKGQSGCEEEYLC